SADCSLPRALPIPSRTPPPADGTIGWETEAHSLPTSVILAGRRLWQLQASVSERIPEERASDDLQPISSRLSDRILNRSYAEQQCPKQAQNSLEWQCVSRST